MLESFRPQAPSDPEEIEFHRLYGAWAVVRPTDVAAILGDFAGPWWIAGGWALDAHTGTSRPHDDVDVVIFDDDVPELQRASAGRLDLWCATSGALRPLNEQFPELLDDSRQVWTRTAATRPWLLDIQFNPRRDGDWVLRRDPTVSAPLERVTRIGADGIRYLAPEMVLIFKAKLARPKDLLDLDRTWPTLDDRQRDTLRTHLRTHHPGHDWLSRID